MGLVVETELFPEYLQIRLSGEYTFDEILNFVEASKKEAVSAGRNRILVDARELTGTISESHKFFIGTRIAEVYGPMIKAVLIMKPGTITKLGETVAVNRGARFFVTHSEDEAIEWLLG